MNFNLEVEQLSNQSIDNFFEENNISDYMKRVHMLNKYMGACDNGECLGAELNEFNLYELTKEIILDKDWLAFQ